MKLKHLGRTAAYLLCGTLAFGSAWALDTKSDSKPATPPGISVDEKPLDRDGLRSSYAATIKRVAPSIVKIDITGKAQNIADFNGDGQPDRRPPFSQNDLRRFFGGRDLPQQREHGAASGVIVTPNGYGNAP